MADLYKTLQEKRRFSNITHVTSDHIQIVYFTYKDTAKDTDVPAHSVKYV